MTTVTNPPSVASRAAAAEPVVVALKRRTIDSVLIGLGAVVAVVLVVAGGLLTWGARFSNDYVHDELASQNIVFPDAAALTEEGRTDLGDFAGTQLTTGRGAEAYASYIDGHLQETAGGQTYADLGGPERAATTALKDATAKGAPAAEVAELKASADTLTGQRNSLFKGETLRGLLLSAFAWSTVGRIAGIAATVAFVAAGLMVLLVLFGLRHHHKVVAGAS